MNRAQRRLNGFRNRPSGLFLGELGKRSLETAYREAMRSEIEQEANGKPIDPRVAALMTKAKEPDQLYQVIAPVKREDGLTDFKRCGPMMNADACGLIAATINKEVLKGTRADLRGWGTAVVAPMQRIEQ